MRTFPRLLLDGLNVQFYFGGTSLLIVVGVAMDTVNQIEAQLIMRHYEGFTPRAGRIRGRVAAASRAIGFNECSRLCLHFVRLAGFGQRHPGQVAEAMHLGIAHISTGDMLRERIAPGTRWGQTVAVMMQAGRAGSGRSGEPLVEERIDQPDCATGFILDGYPQDA